VILGSSIVKGKLLTCVNVQQLKCLESNGKLGESFLFQLFKRQHLQTRLHTLHKHTQYQSINLLAICHSGIANR